MHQHMPYIPVENVRDKEKAQCDILELHELHLLPPITANEMTIMYLR